MYKGNLEPITNRQTWSDTFTCVLSPGGAAIDVSAATFSIYVRNPKTKQIELQDTGAGGHFTMPGGGTDGVVTWTFSATETRTLGTRCDLPLTYDVALYINIAGVVTPLALLSLPVLDGISP